MPQLINYGNEILRVSPKGVEYSTTGGRSWNSRYTGSAYGTFQSLADGGRELLANTSRGGGFTIQLPVEEVGIEGINLQRMCNW